MLKLNDNTVCIGNFPNGESFADVNRSSFRKDVNTITLRYESDIDLMTLKFLVDSIRNTPKANKSEINLVIPYMPYSRMDRQEEDRLFTFKSVADFINYLHFDSVEVWEPHSNVCTALIDRVEVKWVSKDLAIKAMMDTLELEGSAWYTHHKEIDDITDAFTYEGLIRRAKEANIWLVYPDAGAEKRYSKQIYYENTLTCEKVRDFKTGKLTSFKVNLPDGDNKYDTAIIVDDLCSKGGTFVGVAEKLKEIGFSNIILCITHCENTVYKGKVFSSGLFSTVYTTNSLLSLYNEDTGYTKLIIRRGGYWYE